jgi:hypothetical protein
VDYGLLKKIMANNSQWGVKNLEPGGNSHELIGLGTYTTYTKNASYTENVENDANTWSLDWLRQAVADAENLTEQSAQTQAADSSTTPPTGVRAWVDPLISLKSMNYESASPEKQNLMNWAKKIVAVHQWEQANNISFSSSPTTPGDKAAYNNMLLKAMKDGVQPLHGFRSSLNIIEGTDWMIADGAEALVGHEILHWIGAKATNASSDSFKNEYGAVDQRINEYGFAMDMPGVYKDLSYLVTDLVMPDGTTTKAPIFGMDGGQTYTPEIHFTDALGLAGMSLDDRKLFLEMTQKILDKVMPGMDARQLKFSTGQLTKDDVKNNTFSLTLDVAWLSNEQRNTIEQALNQNRQLYEMKHKADQSGNKGVGEFTISVLDAQGNALAKDQIRLIAGNQSVIASVDTIKDLDHMQIYNFIANGVLPTNKANVQPV